VASKPDIYAAGTILCNKAEANSDDARPLKFVNISHPESHGRRAKKSIGNHASQKFQQVKRGSGKSVNRAGTTVCKNTLQSNISSSASEPQSLPRPPSARLDPFATFPVTMEPYMDTLLHRCKRLPQISNPSRKLTHCLLSPDFALVPSISKSPEAAQEWVSLAMTDAALFHSILCGSALYRDLLTRRRDSVERFTHMKESLHLLNTRLQVSDTALLDSTLLAVALLAEFEARTLFLLLPSHTIHI
jgi:hypothetical protein